MMDRLNTLVVNVLTRNISLKREEGQAMAEYALVLALVALAVVAVVTTLGTKISSEIGNVTSKLP